ncbi:hypothetical protein [Caballeronia sp. KNU42]
MTEQKTEKNEPEFSEFSDQFITDWKRARNLIEHEDELIHQRTTWLATINAFLFSGYFLGQKADTSTNFKSIAELLLWIIPLIGVCISASIMVGIVAAMRQLTIVRNWWQRRKADDPRNFAECPDDCNDLRHPPIVGFRGKHALPHDLMITKVLPGLVILIWVIILAYLIWTSFANLLIPARFVIVVGIIATIAFLLMALKISARS